MAGPLSRLRERAADYADHVYNDNLKLIGFGLLYMLRPQTVFALATSLVGVWLCAPSRLALSWDTNFQVIVFGLIFPTTFAVTENFKRREYIADVMAQMKASAVSVYWAHRDWNRGCAAGGAPLAPTRPALPGPPQLSRSSSLLSQVAPPQQLSAHAQNALDVLREFLVNVRGYVMADDADQTVVDAYFARALRSISTLHVLNEVLCDAAGYTKGGEGGISRVTQFTRFLLLQLEQLKIMRLYAGVPHGMRVFVAFMCATTPVLLAPYFRNFCADADATAGKAHIKRLSHWSGADPCAPGYFAAAMYCVVVCTLYAVLTEIEDLYDGKGLDDIHFNLDAELDMAAAAAPFAAMPPRCSDREPGAHRVHIVYDDCLGRLPTTAMAAADDTPRVFAHRDPTKRLSGRLSSEATQGSRRFAVSVSFDASEPAYASADKLAAVL